MRKAPRAYPTGAGSAPSEPLQELCSHQNKGFLKLHTHTHRAENAGHAEHGDLMDVVRHPVFQAVGIAH
eukprot:2523059-Alexandrium_andersonii.AAC.1